MSIVSKFLNSSVHQTAHCNDYIKIIKDLRKIKEHGIYETFVKVKTYPDCDYIKMVRTHKIRLWLRVKWNRNKNKTNYMNYME